MASIIKPAHFQSHRLSVSAEVFNWEDVTQRARQYLEQVRQEAAALLAQAQAQADQLREQSRQAGLAAGEQEVDSLAEEKARLLAQQQVDQTASSLKQLQDQLTETTQDWLRQWQHQTIPLAIAIAEKLVAQQVDADPQLLLDWLAESLRLAEGARRLQVRIHPETADKLQPHLSEWLTHTGKGQQIELINDASLDRVGVVVQSDQGTIDSQLSIQLQRLREQLQGSIP